MDEHDHILKVLEETKNAIVKEDALTLKELSNQTIHRASINQDPNSIAIAVVVYSLGKIFEREKYKKLPGWTRFYTTIMSSLTNSIKDLKQNNDKKFGIDFELIREAINKLSGKLKKYIQEVFRHAQINKASRIYEHGISMEQTSKLLGISMFELAEYAGQTGISDVPISKTMDVKSRIKLAREMFG